MSHPSPNPLANPIGSAQSFSFGYITSLSSPSVISQARSQIDKELIALDESMRVLRTRRNSLAPISRLPPELLSTIFTHCAHSPHLHEHATFSIRFIKVGHVCRHWRAVALGCPSLWSNLVFSYPRWTDEMLIRSKMAPLVVKVDLTYMTPKVVEALQQALKHSIRVKDFKLIASKEMMEKLLNQVSGPAPLLESLSLSNSRYSHYTTESGYPLPEVMFEGQTPRLRRLELFKCDISWNSALLSGLTHLDIRNTAASARPTMSQVLSALERMPSLQVLTLEESLPTLPESVHKLPTIGCVVPLQALRSIRLSGRVIDCAHVLAHMSYPSTATLKLACKAGPAASFDFSSIFPAVVANCGGSGTSGEKPLRHLQVHNLAPNSVRFQGWHSPEPPLHVFSNIRTAAMFSQDEPTSPQIEIDMSWSSFGSDKPMGVVQSMCNVLPLAYVRTLHVHNFSYVPKSFWLDAFGGLTRLRTIRSSNIPIEGLIDALVTEVPGSGRLLRPKKFGEVFLPTVCEVVLEGVDFEDGSSLLDDLLDCMMDRAERRAEIRNLSIQDCRHIYSDDVERLEEVVVDVVWDGIEQGYEDEEEEEDEEESDPYYHYPTWDDDDDDYMDWHLYF
ncbi:hypothetical protein SERLA73DRAFT_161770 [Serpula lacrymans var. lacrymans S7.3]|uniref:F-box domain-containing protein n=2 Tax=Serpula lacrymans var. lacrymans TaxID=341189 RepID=F8Q3Q0_SERL3|nr:uncharacterized protein SERLADRAFT_451219 [Serpula lacrymans var. lacrymans S7.9]EGN96756.1 hypothetical protein SERLA73DRAFT_161770 [Serpula lacrymans var. lacrymans S7.3]EGO22362.1 hypothetical protein SERLADRAFT_451219 [Serpula lacrymans var. lacrymans S7.9]